MMFYEITVIHEVVLLMVIDWGSPTPTTFSAATLTVQLVVLLLLASHTAMHSPSLHSKGSTVVSLQQPVWSTLYWITGNTPGAGS